MRTDSSARLQGRLIASSADAPLVSIVMPVRNGASFIADAIASARRQTYERWELIVADNASTDSSVAIAERAARDDGRIRVATHTQCVDVISSFNRAFGLMSPEARYCKPLATDDLLVPECLERMVELAERHREIGLVSAYRQLETRVDFVGVPRTLEVAAGQDICRASLLGGVWVFGSSSSTMIRSDLVRKRSPFYDPGLLHADVAACYDVLQESAFGFVHEILTYTRRQSGAVTHGAKALMTHRPEGILIYQRFAPACLSKDEYERRLAVLLAAYIVDLARHPARLMRRNVRSYHLAFLRRLFNSATPEHILRGSLLQARRMLRGSRLNGAAWLAAKYGDMPGRAELPRMEQDT